MDRPPPAAPGPTGCPADPSMPVITDKRELAEALQRMFLHNADRGDNAANTELVRALSTALRVHRGR